MTTNNPPVLTNRIDVIGMTVNSSNTYTLVSDMFTDLDLGDQFSIRMTLANGADFPSWLSGAT